MSELYKYISQQEFLIILVLTGILMIRTCYLIIYRKAIYKRQKTTDNPALPAISVIVYACNDAGYIKDNLPEILEQDYPQFEVIVVNDGSTDETNEELKLLEARYPNLYHTYLPEEAKTQCRRKLALNMALKAARYDWLVMTTANTYPVSRNWLGSLGRNMDETAEVVLAYSGLRSTKIRGTYYKMDNMFFQLRYLALAKCNKPYMGVGNNLAFRKSIYQQRLFSGILNIPVGEDDIPVNRIANSRNTRVELSPESITEVKYQYLSKAWRERKMGYSLSRKYYKNKNYRWWEPEPLVRYSYWIVLFLSIVKGYFCNWIFALIFVKFSLLYFLFYYFTINRLARQFGEPRFGISLLRREFSQPFVDLFYKKKGRRYS
ncbi:MAG: glycosyltransferase [Bacteroidales bacterium]